MKDVNELVHLLLQDEQVALDELNEAIDTATPAELITPNPHIDACAKALQASRIALGRVLAWNDGTGREDQVTAFNRGRDYADARRAASSTGSNADDRTRKERAADRRTMNVAMQIARESGAL